MNTSLRPTRLLLPVALAAAAMLTGCGQTEFIPSAPSPSGLSSPAAGLTETDSAQSSPSVDRWADPAVWPKRLAVRTGLSAWARAQVDPARPIMGLIVPAVGPLQAAGASRPAQEKVERELYADVQSMMRRRTGGSAWRDYTVVGEGPGSYLFVTSDDPYATTVWDGPAGKPVSYFKFISARPAEDAGAVGREVVFTDDSATTAAPAAPADSRRLLLERTWFALYTPRTATAKGLIVLLPGMFGTPQPIVQQFVGELRARGYAVLRTLAHPSRFTEQVTFGIVESADLKPQAELVARTLTDRAAECAYAVQAALLHTRDTNPTLRDLPVTLVGMSGGAMVAPTVLARSPASFHAAVLIAGGSDFLQVALESNYKDMIDALHFVWFPTRPTRPEPKPRPDGRTPPTAGMMRADDKPSPDLLSRFVELYHQAAPLDSVSTGTALRQVHSLFMLADGDKAVPYARGLQLWRAAGKPDRFSVRGGHETLFLFLPGSFSKLIGWIDNATAQASKPKAK